MNDTFSFNLVDEPWLPYVALDGQPGTRSLLDALIDAHRIRDLTVDVPTQYPPILRLLLAFLHRALAPKEGEGNAFPKKVRQWHRLHREGAFPTEKIKAYADTWRDRFDLFSLKAPFMQFTKKGPGEGGGPSNLLISYASAGNNAPIFSPDRDEDPTALSPAEAARWLLHTHAWDTAGTKTGAKEDPTAKQGKAYGNRIGPLGELGVLVPTGNSLFETLMYNLLVLENETTPPVWERPPMTAVWATRPPRGPIDLYTWPSRRIRLMPERVAGTTVVHRALVCAGDRVEIVANSLSANEPHTAWVKNKPRKQATDGERPSSDRRPLQHTPGQELWRGLGGILGWDRGLQQTNDLKPRALVHLGRCFDPEEGQELPVLRLRAFGIGYGPKNSTIDDTYADVLPLPVALLMEGESWEPLGSSTVKCVADTERAAWALGQLAADLAFAEGAGEDEEEAARDRVRRQYFATLDHHFRSWIAEVTEPASAETYSREWRTLAAKEARKLKKELVTRTGPGALRIRTRKEKGRDNKPVAVNSILAQRSFNGRLRAFLRIDPTTGEQ